MSRRCTFHPARLAELPPSFDRTEDLGGCARGRARSRQ